MVAEAVLPVVDDTVAARPLDSEAGFSLVERMVLNHFGDREVLLAKMHGAQLNRFFSFGAHGSDSTDRPELTRIALRRAAVAYGEPAAEQLLVIGDTPHDVEGAHPAETACLGVGSHNLTVAQLFDVGADYVIASLAERLPR